MKKQIKEHGIIFNGEMVRAILDRRKTQTRRVIKNQPFDRSWSRHDHHIEIVSGRADEGDEIDGLHAYTKSSGGVWSAKCPFGQVGDRLWVRESFGFSIRSVGGSPHEQLVFKASKPDAVRYYDCNGVPSPMKWSPSSQMPRKYSRITLEITDIRVERLQDISEEDAKAEGAPTECCVIGDKHFLGFRRLWKSIYGQDSWQSNPFVWVVEFKRVEAA